MNSLSKQIVVVGTTATGKSSLAIELAQTFKSEIISLDSMQIYKGMEIGTGVVPVNERKSITHHMMSFVEPTEVYSVSQFKNDVYSILDRSTKKYTFAGGTGLYTHAVIDNFSFAPTDPSIRQKVIDEFQLDEENPNAERVDTAYKYLYECDPDAAQKIDPNNVRRIIRALEAIALTKEKFSSTGSGVQTFGEPFVDVHMIGLRFGRDILKDRIAKRVDQMFRDGWIDECESLIPIWDEISVTAKSAIGYQLIVDWILNGKRSESYDELREKIINKTSQFSRRQRKWFERDPRVNWIECDELNENQIFEVAHAQIVDHI